MAVTLHINGSATRVEADNDIPLLWVLRDQLGLTGTKYSCGIGVCGSCMVLLDDMPAKACLVKATECAGKKITTIEGLADQADHPLLKSWLELQVPQCGYCQSGQIITAYALLSNKRDPSADEIDQAMSQVLCRCGTYPRIRQAIQQASELMRAKDPS
ncbi:MAG: (2Fe-2S)-binding protein [Candidatus Thiodiazotropha weberae]|uniref:(2Fe-2S)-binding protein n=1 Tax=Candidatus Thiodiazotropha endoloripes TaxID=1818881 RepID=A0A1E2UVI0_9GAMM|nr:(2Fe-2S)-binding protein [Candidatus Thiodiazotropha endoloripes]MCG7898446.1 (2Fe-2S)-binding protein [Candidatus Thiodiazotropha weberae]MCG7913408.1 (2Fe-2S)-binding protein [Candidatus Thiodiazotropha weberae]ODB87247.1 (2Fe-2S)-binding protein [Candidatus Thiodiazotropha endoloripes]ODB89929.1 (2Fe-2S)-binding protein [Candidatus Thiodiazotropha endoloripes]ODB98612.1 (2Fe-2S)-binding protein [Candidatus Thiodiazotropha endoloripes]